MSFVLLGSLALVGAIAGSSLIPTSLVGRVVGAVLVVLFGFLFVTVSSRITGEMGSSSNPISGMTIATLLLTCAVFVILGWIGPEYRLTALMIAGVVCIASSNGGTTSQDLKTGYLVGATPWAQQVAILVGTLTSALVIGGTLLLLELGLHHDLRQAGGLAATEGRCRLRWRTPRLVPMGSRTKSGGLSVSTAWCLASTWSTKRARRGTWSIPGSVAA